MTPDLPDRCRPVGKRYLASAPISVTRLWTPADAQWYVDQLSEAQIQRFTTEPAETTVEQFRDALAELADADDQFGRAIIDPDSGELAGNLVASGEGDVALIGYWIAENLRSRGLARRAVNECCAWVGEHWPTIKRAQLSIHPANAVSIRVAAATGFSREPSRDKVLEVRGERRPMHAYVRHLREPVRSTSASPSAPRHGGRRPAD